jgi:proline iminopeptidase
MEVIREYLGISQWVVFGGSWGSTLSLVYTLTHPSRVMGLILRGIFLCGKRDLHWFYQEGASFIFPDYWEEFIQPVAEVERLDLISAYYRLLTSDNDFTRSNAARAWSVWEGRCATLQPNPELQKHFSELHFALALARIECHYFVHDSFLGENFILNNAHKLRGIPGVIVHGRYDVVCPLENAWKLNKAWPEAELQIIRDAGHAATEPGTTDALVRATQNMARRFGKKNRGA